MIQGARTTAKDLVFALRSPDGPTRRAAVIFFAGIVGALYVSATGFHRWREIRRHRHAGPSQAELDQKHLSEFLEKQKREAEDRASQLELGTFTVELKLDDSKAPKPRGLNLGEVDLVAHCKDRETRAWLEEHPVPARNAITDALVPERREALMSAEGKTRLKKRVIEKLNALLEQSGPGEAGVKEVFITRLVID